MRTTTPRRALWISAISVAVFIVLYVILYSLCNSGAFAHIEWIDRLAGP